MPLQFPARERSAGLERCLLRQSPDVLVAIQADEAVLLEPRGERYYTLNDVGRHVWSLLESPTTLARIVTSVREAYDVPLVDDHDPVRSDVTALLHDLLAAKLLVADPVASGTP